MHCLHCGTRLPRRGRFAPSFRFCPTCGTALRNEWAWLALGCALLAGVPALRVWAGLAAVLSGLLGWRRARTATGGRGRWVAGAAVGVGGVVALGMVLPSAWLPSAVSWLETRLQRHAGPTPAPNYSTHMMLGRDWARSVAFSPDGKMLAGGGGDTVRLWDVQTGVLQRTLEHVEVSSVTFSPDGETVASGGLDKTVRLWDVRTGELKRRLTGHGEGVSSVVFSRDGKMLASGGGDGTLRLWEAPTGELKRVVQERVFGLSSSSVDVITFLPDGKTVVSTVTHAPAGSRSSPSTEVKLWDTQTGALLQTLRHSGVTAVALSPDGKMLATGDYAHSVSLWDVPTGVLQRTLRGHGSHVTAVAFSPDGRTLASGSKDKAVRVWDVQTGDSRWAVQGHRYPVKLVAFSSDSQTVASGSMNEVRVWSVATSSTRAARPATPQLAAEITPWFIIDCPWDFDSPRGSGMGRGAPSGGYYVYDNRTGEVRIACEVINVGEEPKVIHRIESSLAFDNSVVAWFKQTDPIRMAGESAGDIKLRYSFNWGVVRSNAATIRLSLTTTAGTFSLEKPVVIYPLY